MLPLSGKAPIPGIVPMALDDSRDSLPWKLFEIPCNPERWISKGRFLDSACLSGCFPEKPYQNSKLGILSRCPGQMDSGSFLESV